MIAMGRRRVVRRGWIYIFSVRFGVLVIGVLESFEVCRRRQGGRDGGKEKNHLYLFHVSCVMWRSY